MIVAGTGHPAPLHRRQPDGATADHHRRRAPPQVGDPGRGTDPGHHTAPQQRRPIERHRRRHADRALCWNHAVFGEPAEIHQLVHRHALARQPRTSIEVERLRPIGEELRTQDRLRVVAIEAVPTMRVPRQHHAIADRKFGDASAEFDHLAGRLMPQHRRQLHGQGAFDRLKIRVAQAGGADTDEHVAGSDRPDLQTSRWSSALRSAAAPRRAHSA